MNNTKETFVTGFALFAMFFGAGNLLLPPMLGYNAGDLWWLVLLGFVVTAVVIPLVGILAHAKLQGTMYDFAKKVSPIFSVIYCVIVYLISVALPSPRTASATHEIVIIPLFKTASSSPSPLLTSAIYFALVLVFVLNRSKILSLIGKYLTPLIVTILLCVIGIGLFSAEGAIATSITSPFVGGVLEGYQTFDAIGAVVIGGVVIISIKLRGHQSFEENRRLIAKAGLIAGAGLFIMYAGLIAVGAYFNSEVVIDPNLTNDEQRALLLNGISAGALGNVGSSFLGVLIALACFTTAVGIITGAADYFKGLFNGNQKVYVLTAVIACLVGIGVGQLDFHSIVVIAIPVLFLIYPVTIVLIFLNVLPSKIASKLVFRVVVVITLIFSLPDFLGYFWEKNEAILAIRDTIPFAKHHFGWVLPALFGFGIVSIFKK